MMVIVAIHNLPSLEESYAVATARRYTIVICDFPQASPLSFAYWKLAGEVANVSAGCCDIIIVSQLPGTQIMFLPFLKQQPPPCMGKMRISERKISEALFPTYNGFPQ